MALAAGTRLGAYEITGSLGAGGMGEVYRATDLKLGRELAIKTLPAALASDEDRLARFEREAKLLAALNHAHIASVYSLDEHEGTQYLAMELVEGETLEQKLKKGPLPVEDALRLAVQIAEALEAAHEKGVVHRDLKPANVMVTGDGQVKVLDFGLAKAFSGDPNQAAPAHSPALSAAMTQQGLILGTAGYMSPEQASGQATDQRADIWAFGVVLYEMLTGMPLFSGESVPHVLADVLRTEPDWSRLPKNLHPRIRQMLERCLTKRVRNRYHSMADVRVDIEDVLADPRGVLPLSVGETARRSRVAPWAVGASLLVAVVAVAAALAVWLRSPPGPRAEAARLVLSLPSGTELQPGPSVAISPDGARVAYVATRGGRQQLYLRPMNGFEAQPITGTEGAAAPFFSPDGSWLGFFADGQLKKISTSGGVVEVLAEAQGDSWSGGSWGPNDAIVFRGPSGRLLEVSSAGGAPRPLISTDQGGEPRFFGSPTYLPGGEAVLFTSTPSGVRTAAGHTVEVLNLETGVRKVLLQGASDGRYLPTGHLVFLRAGVLMAVPFDLDRLELAGTPVPVIEGVRTPWSGLGAFSCSGTGTCVYIAGGLGGQRTVALVDRTGTGRTLPLQPQRYSYPRFSPSGGQIAFWVTQLACDIARYDLARGNLSVIASDGDNHFPVWTHDGERIMYASSKLDAMGYEVFARPADGSGAEERVSETLLNLGPGSQLSSSPTGEVLAFVKQGDIWLFPLAGEGEPQPFFQSRAAETAPAFSPGGSWLAYVSDESGRQQVYVRPVPGPGAPYPISTDGGTEPVWASDGRELFFREGDRMMAVQIRPQPTFTATRPSLLFNGPFARGFAANYDVSPDGQTFVMLNPGEDDEVATQINVLLGWFPELQERVPVP